MNGCWDYVSLGVTRWLLRAGTRSPARAIFFGVLDFGAALVFFTALGCTLIGAIHLANGLAGQPLVDLGALFDSLRHPAQPGQNVWIYGMIFSTLLPTYAHFAVASFSALAWLPALPHWARGWLDSLMTEEEKPDPAYVLLLSLSATVMLVLALVVPLILIGGAGYCLWALLQVFGEDYLSLFERFAQLLGAPVTPQPELIST